MTIRVTMTGWAGQLAKWWVERRQSRERRRTAAFRRLLDAQVDERLAADAAARQRQRGGVTAEEAEEGFRRLSRAGMRLRNLTEEDTRR